MIEMFMLFVLKCMIKLKVFNGGIIICFEMLIELYYISCKLFFSVYCMYFGIVYF